MKATKFGFAALALLGACAVQENPPGTTCNAKSVSCDVAGGGAGGGSAGTATAAGAESGGADTSGGATSAGADQGGAPAGGALGAAGSPAGGAPAGGAPAGGAPAGGAPAGGAPAGGAPAGGAPAAGAPAGGSGGAPPNPACTKPIAARTTWTATASSYSGDGPTGVCATMPTSNVCDLPIYAFDAAGTSTRFSTGKKQVGAEWLEIDLGAAKASLNGVIINTTNSDFGVHIKVRMSDTPQGAAPTSVVLAEADGMKGPQTIMFPITTARYLLLSQTGMFAMGAPTSWWSIHDMTVECK